MRKRDNSNWGPPTIQGKVKDCRSVGFIDQFYSSWKSKFTSNFVSKDITSTQLKL